MAGEGRVCVGEHSPAPVSGGAERGRRATSKVEAELQIAVQANAKDCVGALRDVYTTEGRALIAERAQIEVCTGIDRTHVTESVRGTVLLGENAPGVGTVVAVRVRPELGQWQNENGRGRIEGVLEATVLYMPGGSDLPAAARAELPFSVETPGELNDESWITVEVVSAEANALMSDRLEMKTLLNIGCELAAAAARRWCAAWRRASRCADARASCCSGPRRGRRHGKSASATPWQWTTCTGPARALLADSRRC